MEFSKGSEWRKWDLHLHTPSSYDYDYKADDADDSFVNSIYAYDDHLIITCNYKDGKLKIPFEDIQGSDLVRSGVPKITQTHRRLGNFLRKLNHWLCQW